MKAEIFNIEEFNNKYYKHNLVIEASAGTGKTYSVTKMVKKLVKNGIKPTEILIVTYTEKATGELKDRIRKELNDKSLRINKSDLDNLNIYTIHSFCQNSIKEFGLLANQPLQLDVIDEPTEVKDFFDIYARNNKKLLEYIDKIYSKLNNNFRIVDINENANDLKKYFISVILKYYLNDEGNVDKEIISLKKLDNDLKIMYDNATCDVKISFDEYLKLDSQFNAYYNSLLSVTPPNKKCDELANEIKNNFDAYQTIDFNGRSYTTKSFKTPLEQELLDFFKKKREKFEKLKDSKSACIYLTVTFIDDFYKEWQCVKEKNKWQTFNDMLRTIREIINSEYKKKDKPFTNALKKKYKYAIIDEFQDTNQLQFDTFKRLFMYDDDKLDLKHNIIVVGDPKQSIYAFQGADLSVYEKAKEEIVSKNGLFLRLNTNYRSTKNMIDSCNKIFEDGFFPKQIDENNDGDIFAPSESPKPNLREAKLSNSSTKSIWIGMKKAKKHIVTETAEEIEARNEIEEQPESEDTDDLIEYDTSINEYEFAKIAVSSIVDCCKYVSKDKTALRITDKEGNERNVSFKDFAILARTRTEMSPIERELKRCGIPYIKYKDNGLFSTKECDEWKAIFEVINTADLTGYNRKKYKKALYTEFFGKNLTEINDEFFNHDNGFEIDCVKRWKKLAKEYKWEDLIEDIIFNSNLLDNLKSLDKLQSLTLYKQLGDFCISYLYDNHNLTELINRLNNISNDDDDENSGIVEIGTDFDCVKLMTIHASKGLQYPIVISIAGYKGPKDSVECTFHDKDDNNYRKITFNSEDAEAEACEEWIRLLYVCFTRAEYINILPFYNKKANYYSELLFDRMLKYIEAYEDKNEYKKVYLNKINYSNTRNEVKNILNKNNSSKSATIPSNIKEFIRSLNSKKSYKHSYASLSHPKGETEVQEEFEDDEMEKEGIVIDSVCLKEFDLKGKRIDTNLTSDSYLDYEGFPRGATIGTALHEVFEYSDFTNCKPKLDEIITERLKTNRIKETKELKDYITRMVDNVLNADLPIIHGSESVGKTFKLKEIPNSDKKPEIEFNFNLGSEKLKNYFNGFIDLVFRKDNYYCILDWKSDTISDDLLAYNNEDIDSLKNHTDNHYSIQRVLYSYCLIQWLKMYYPKETEEQIFDKRFGGVYYVYIRGCNKDTGNGIYAHTWESYNDLETAFKNIINKKIGGKSYEI